MSQNTNNNKKILIIAIIVLAVILVAGLVFMGIRLWQQFGTAKVAITESYSHSVPRELGSCEAVTLKNEEGFRDTLAIMGGYSQVGEPLYYYDEKGNTAGQYVYDEFGWVYGWRDENGKVNKLPEDEQFESPYVMTGGEPLLMTGEVQMHFIVYTENDNATCAYLYFILSDDGDMVAFQEAMARANYGVVEKVSRNVAEMVMDKAAIDSEMNLVDPEYSSEAFIQRLIETFGVTR